MRRVHHGREGRHQNTFPEGRGSAVHLESDDLELLGDESMTTRVVMRVTADTEHPAVAQADLADINWTMRLK